MKGQIAVGYTVGNGAAINISLGWVPDYVKVVNTTDGDLVTEAFLKQAMAFSSGGTTEVKKGDTVIGATSNATAVVQEVLLSSGSWAGGDAAGFFVLTEVDGTFGSENVRTTGSNDATVTAVVTPNVATAAAVAGATGNAALSRYAGDVDNPKGFTIGSTVAEEAKLLAYTAYRADM